MNIVSRIIIFFSILVFATSCSNIHGQFVTEHKNAWIDGYEGVFGKGGSGLVYCMANEKSDNLADPICFETRFEEYDDEKKRRLKQKRLEEKYRRKNN